MKEITKKIINVMREVQYLTKDLHVIHTTMNYKAISDLQVTIACREAMIKNNLCMLPISMDEQIEIIQNDKKSSRFVSMLVTFRLIDQESGEYIDIQSKGHGIDNQDKAIGKAMTYAKKYAMLNTFLIPTGDDPDYVNSQVEQKKEDIINNHDYWIDEISTFLINCDNEINDEKQKAFLYNIVNKKIKLTDEIWLKIQKFMDSIYNIHISKEDSK